MKKIIFKSLFLIILISSWYYIFHLNGVYEIRDYLNQNSIEINVSNELKIEKVDIIWTGEFRRPEKIVSKGKETGIIYKEYGKNTFVIIYDKDTVGAFRYFKGNNWYGHEHVIQLTKNNKNIQCNIDIFGPNAKTKTNILERLRKHTK